MKEVIAVCGAGGKSTLIKQKAIEYKNKNKKVLITTTTHMLKEDVSGVDFLGVKVSDIKYGYVGDDLFYSSCNKYDIILVEADGSRMMPLKIPNKNFEPSIPENVTEICCIYNNSCVGRKISAVCFRYNDNIVNLQDENMPLIIKEAFSNKNYIVNEELIKNMMEYFYITPLKNKYPNIKINKKIIDIEDNTNYIKYNKINISILASGFSKRYGKNKLLEKFVNNKMQYVHIIDIINKSKNKIIEHFKKLNHNIDLNISIITQYDEILNDRNIDLNIIKIKNDNASVGQSNSIHLAINNFKNYDAICFIPADLVTLNDEEIFLFIKNFLYMNKNISCMCCNDIKMSPCIISNKFFDEALNISGDMGLRNIFQKNLADLLLYHINEEDIIDIDSKEDLNKLRRLK